MTTRRRIRAYSLLTASALALGACSSSNTPAASPTTTPTAGVTTTAAGGTSGKGSAGKGNVGTDVAGAPAPVSQLSGPITVGLDFLPERDGFAFENYGKNDARPNLTPSEMERYFGDKVCSSKADGQCQLTPPAKQWMEATNEGMNGGHCEGMAALAILIKKGTAKSSDFGSELTNALTIDGNERLAREIAFWFATQALDPTVTAELKTLKPSEIVAKLKESFQPDSPESYTLGIYKTVDGKKKEGHAITPFGLVELPDGKVEIAIYDNNFPGQTRAVVVDTAAEKWTYSTATNPAEPVGLYEGDASTFSLTVTPSTARLANQQCPFCGDAAAASGSRGGTKGATLTEGEPAAPGDYGYVFLNDAGDEGGVDIKITNLDDTPLEGATEITTKSDSLAQDDAPPVYQVPAGKAFKVLIDGTNVTEEANTDITYVGADTDLYIDDIMVDPGQVDAAIIDPAAGSISYATKKTEAPLIGAGFSGDGADYAFAIGGVDLPDGGTVTMTLDRANGTFTIKNEDEKAGTYAVGMERYDEAGEQTFTDEGFELPAGASVTIAYAGWSAKADKLKLTIDLGDGTPPAETEIESDK